MERSRPRVKGSTMPGKSSVLRTGMMINASAGTGRAGGAAPCAALSSDGPSNCISATQGPRFLQRDQETAVAGAAFDRAVAAARQPQAALEAALRELEAMDNGSAQLLRQHPRPSDDEVAAVEHCF